jgi:hypothetical protein
MRFFASWWERIPVRGAAPALVAVVAALGGFGNVEGYARGLIGPCGFLWG